MAGTVEKGETPVEGLIRELQEEIGMTITEFTLLNKYNKNGKMFNVYYIDSPDFDESRIRLNFEHTEFRYFTYNEILTSKQFIHNYRYD